MWAYIIMINLIAIKDYRIFFFDSIGEIGKFKTVQRLVNLNADRKRIWFEELGDVNDGKIVDLMSISISFV